MLYVFLYFKCKGNKADAVPCECIHKSNSTIGLLIAILLVGFDQKVNRYGTID